MTSRWPSCRIREKSRPCLTRMARLNFSGLGNSAAIGRGLDWRQAFAAHASAIGQSSLAALAAVAIQKAVLPFAADFRRLILSLHKFKSICCPKNIKRHRAREQPREPERGRIAAKKRVSTVEKMETSADRADSEKRALTIMIGPLSSQKAAFYNEAIKVTCGFRGLISPPSSSLPALRNFFLPRDFTGGVLSNRPWNRS